MSLCKLLYFILGNKAIGMIVSWWDLTRMGTNQNMHRLMLTYYEKQVNLSDCGGKEPSGVP